MILLIFSSPILCLVILTLVSLIYRKITSKVFKTKRLFQTFAHQHVVITGGSEGLGLALAKACVHYGAKVTILSRSQSKLDEAISSIVVQYSSRCSMNDEAKKPPPVQAFSVDVTDRAALHQVFATRVRNSAFGDIDIFISCAGSAKTGKFTNHSGQDFNQAMQLNYMASVYACEYLLPHMTYAHAIRELPHNDLLEASSGTRFDQDHHQNKRICFIASALALTSYVGYTAYAPTKYALRGLADTLRNEMKDSNVKMHIAYPGQMNTRGFDTEQATKPRETLAIEAADAVYEPEDVAQMILESMSEEQYNIYCGALDMQLLGIATAGLSPRSNAWLDMLVLPWTVLISAIVRYDWDTKVKKQYYD